MTLGIVSFLDDFFTSIEDLVEKHFDNPLLWIMIICMVLVMVAMAFNVLSK